MQSTREDVSTMEDACQAGIRDQEGVDVTVSDRLDAEDTLDGQDLSVGTENIDNAVPRADVQDQCSLPAQDVCVTDTIPLEGGTCPISDQIMEECQLDESAPLDHSSLPVYDEIVSSDQRHDGSSVTSYNLVGEEFNLDSLCSVEADLNSQKTLLTERDNLQCWEADPNTAMDSATNHTDYINTGDAADFGIDAIEHDTDFLNVDDDEVDEVYEGDMPSTEEKWILDNTELLPTIFKSCLKRKVNMERGTSPWIAFLLEYLARKHQECSSRHWFSKLRITFMQSNKALSVTFEESHEETS